MLIETVHETGQEPVVQRNADTDRHLTARVLDVRALSRPDRDRMYQIYQAHYDGTSRKRFEDDLAAKDMALTVHSANGAIQGFTTLLVLETDFAGAPIRAIYSGDTIIDRAYWGSQVLAFTWIRLAGAMKAAEPSVPLYWFLIVKGHRTFRYLSAFSRTFYPHWAKETPAAQRALMDQLAETRFPGFYRPDLGIVHFPESHGHLKPDLAEITPAEAARADVAFFLARNPGYREGDELVCLTELSPENLRPLARKQFLDGCSK
jgi:hypothetical protein